MGDHRISPELASALAAVVAHRATQWRGRVQTVQGPEYAGFLAEKGFSARAQSLREAVGEIAGNADLMMGEVAALLDGATVLDPIAPPPPPPEPEPPTDDAEAYWTALGYTVQVGGTITVPRSGARLLAFIGSTGRFWCDEADGLAFIDCDMRGGQSGGRAVRNVVIDGGRFGEFTARKGGSIDCLQFAPSAWGDPRPENITITRSVFRDVARADSSHTDAIQLGGCFDVLIADNYFDNIPVQMVMAKGWNGIPEGVQVRGNYFGERTNPGGPPLKFSYADGAPCTDCHADGNFYDGTVGVVDAGSVRCSISGTRPRSEWSGVS